MSDSLTKKQRSLQKELDAIAEIVRVDYWNILKLEREARTPMLEVMKREMVRGEVVGQYTIIDDLLSTELVRYFLGGKDMIRQSKTKRFRRFSYYVLERLYLTQKLAFLKDVYSVPKNVASTIEEINALRNAMAHAFFPENLRAYQMKGRAGPRKPITVLYKGLDVFTPAGVQKFADDCGDVFDFLLWKIKRRKKKAAPKPLPTAAIE
jgi:hypothetical protein